MHSFVLFLNFLLLFCSQLTMGLQLLWTSIKYMEALWHNKKLPRNYQGSRDKGPQYWTHKKTHYPKKNILTVKLIINISLIRTSEKCCKLTYIHFQQSWHKTFNSKPSTAGKPDRLDFNFGKVTYFILKVQITII